MSFKDVLNKYIDEIGCSAKELASISGTSQVVISRYRSGDRIPKLKSKQLESLINSLIKIANDKKIDSSNIRTDLEMSLNNYDGDLDLFRKNFNELINVFNINVSDLARFIGYDASYLSKIRSGIRKPYNFKDFTNSICQYVINNYLDTSYRSTLKDILNCKETDLDNKDLTLDKLYYWLTNNVLINDSDKINNFFHKLDDFDLNDYIKAIKFDKLIVPTLPKVLFKTKTYYGFEGCKEAQLEVLKQIAFSKNKDEIFWYSNLPFDEMSKDLKFSKKYMMYLAFILKKGFKLNIVHDLDRPFNELLLGLEGWIPLYMTGQINPYYFKNNSNLIYSQIECSSDSAIMHGDIITGNLDSAKLLVSNKKEDINYYLKTSKLLLKKASSLMDIYNNSKNDEFNKMILDTINIKGLRKNILLSIPPYTISLTLLDKILNDINISKEEKDLIIDYVKKEKDNVSNILNDNEINDEILIYKKEDFEKTKVRLDLSGLFYDKKEIIYSYDNYLEHLKCLEAFKKKNKNYNYVIKNDSVFSNINIRIIGDKQVIISKTNSPITHFVIYHPKLVNAIMNFRTIINEK